MALAVLVKGGYRDFQSSGLISRLLPLAEMIHGEKMTEENKHIKDSIW